MVTTWGDTVDCTCTRGQHEPHNPACLRAITDHTAQPPPRRPVALEQHRIVTTAPQDLDGYHGRCVECDTPITGTGPAGAARRHIETVKGTQ